MSTKKQTAKKVTSTRRLGCIVIYETGELLRLAGGILTTVAGGEPVTAFPTIADADKAITATCRATNEADDYYTVVLLRRATR